MFLYVRLLLENLSKDEDNSIRSSVANHQNTPSHILENLAEDEDNSIRSSVANHQNTPSYILEKLAKDNFIMVRLAIANNPNINRQIIKLLFEDRYNLNCNDLQEIQAAIELEIKRLDWTEERAKKCLEEKFDRRIYDISKQQLFTFWKYLTSIESNSYPKSLIKNVFNDIFLELIPF